MRRLLVLLFIAAAIASIPAYAQIPTVLDYYCVGTTYEVTGSFSCYVSMGPAYLTYAEEEVLAHCSNNNAIDIAEDVFAACSDWTPTASATGFVNWGNSRLPGLQGRAISLAQESNMPGNPQETSTIDCYGVVGEAHQPIFSC